MRTVIPLLQLLALGHQAAASVCRPRVTSSSISLESVTSSASTAVSSTVESTGSESTTWSSTETASSSTETISLSTTETASSSTGTVSLSTTETASSTTETASLSTTDSSTVISTASSASESISTDSSTITSSTFFTSTTSTAEASSTTSSVPEGPPELLENIDFENKDSLSPWEQYQSGTVAISTDVSHQGGQSARVTWSSPVTPFGQYYYYTGIKQPVPASKLLADTPYEFSAWIKMAPGIRCDNFGIACTVANGYTPDSYKAVPIVGSGDWVQAKTTCHWNQARLDLGPGVRVFAYCKEAEYYVDDASLKQII